MTGDVPCRWRGETLVCRLRVQPRAGVDRFAGTVGGRLKVRIGCAPVDGAANEALVRFLADRCGVARSSVQLVSGERGRNKTVEIDSPRRVPAEIRECMDY